MSLTVSIPAALREHTGGAGTVEVADPGRTVGSTLDALFDLHPGLRDRVLTERSELRPHVALFVGTERVDRGAGGLETPLAEASELTIVPAVSGG